MRTVGIIGGIAPPSTIDYYRRIHALYAERTDGASNARMIVNSLDHLELLEHVRHDRREALVRFLVYELGRLAAAGVDFALLSSNTPHLVVDELLRRSPVPLLSIVDVTRDELLRLGVRRCGLLGTGFTMNADFYPRVLGAAGIAVVMPEEDDRRLVHHVYMTELVPGVFRADSRDRVLAIMGRMVERHRLDAIVLAGTELQLLLGDTGALPFLVVETAACHIRATVDELLR
jgi:aspartate racemase